MPDALKEQVFEHLARLVAVADLSEENRIAYDKALDRYRVNQIVEEDERRKNEEMRRKAAEEGMKEPRNWGVLIPISSIPTDFPMRIITPVPMTWR